MDFESNRKKSVMSMIGSATDLEANNLELEAYQAYLASVQAVCSLLASGLSLDTDRSQMISLAKQCLERIQHISDRFGRKKLPPDPDSPVSGAAAAMTERLRRLRGGPAVGPFDPSDSAWSTYRNASICEPGEVSEPSAPPADSPSDSIEDNLLVELESDSENASGRRDSEQPSSIEDNAAADETPIPAPRSETQWGTQPAAKPSNDQNGRPAVRRGSDEEPFVYGTEIHRSRVPIPKPSDDLDPYQELSPLDLARKENERLVASYALRMQRSPKHVQHNLSLELQRRLTENRQLAAVKHQAWMQRRLESREHFLRLAKRVLPEEPPGGHPSPEYLQKQATLADILQFEQSHPWTRQLRDSLDAEPDSSGVVENALLHMLLEKSHPLSKLRQRLQYSLYCKLNPLVEQHAHLLDAVRVPAWSPEPAPVDGGQRAGLWPSLLEEDGEGESGGAEGAVGPEDAVDRQEREQQDEAFRRHLRNVISDTQDSERLLVSLAGAVHPALSGAHSRPVVQRVLFTPLWPHLLVLFRLANRRQERQLAEALTRLAAGGGQPVPARPHRLLLRRLLLATSPADKCRLLVELARALCDTADGPAGADVLLPRLTALVVHSAAPQLLSELQFISEFMSDGSFQGEQGYCLTSLQTALLYLIQQQ
ncbi:VPS9 domain-containing protein 1-like isoform X1 [Amphibalanus amphitrite]|uniref:VPS9 domain-containing protein 1-like isoform X1 n=1 Tax=Amphibalanus amphitrite TaxID=1232801 RepID=UPI001C927B59|nr:VPS9 domain-containing protein 1-like isoform X1 [Amphibalanus amphitrite]